MAYHPALKTLLQQRTTSPNYPRGRFDTTSSFESDDWIPYSCEDPNYPVHELFAGDLVCCQVTRKAPARDDSLKNTLVFYGVLCDPPGDGASQSSSRHTLPDDNTQKESLCARLPSFTVPSVEASRLFSTIPRHRRLKVFATHTSLEATLYLANFTSPSAYGKMLFGDSPKLPVSSGPRFAASPTVLQTNSRHDADFIKKEWDARWSVHVYVPQQYRKQHLFHALPEFRLARSLETFGLTVCKVEDYLPDDHTDGSRDSKRHKRHGWPSERIADSVVLVPTRTEEDWCAYYELVAKNLAQKASPARGSALWKRKLQPVPSYHLEPDQANRSAALMRSLYEGAQSNASVPSCIVELVTT
jgi:hypothetical protein